ncbi:MAG: single-stranded-DNA-specific exonuclease RecJ [Bacillota bacterium]|nr:single-stranded-DNA-specific exonuclease RecJ [Thermoanaerobacteraceae bacterium]
MAGERWHVAPEEPLLRALFVRELGIHPVTAQCLINRGVWSLREAAEFLAGEVAALESPWSLKGMRDAVARLRAAVEKKERILIYGDYDADGVTAAALLFLALKEAGLEAVCHLPSREEGYGLKEPVLRGFREAGVTVVVTVDCGISAYREAVACCELGMDLVVTDHHQPGAMLPEAVAVVNPKQEGCSYPYKDLAGVGVAFKLAEALFESLGKGRGRAEDLLDLVAIGTVADVVPLTGENRVLVRAGLKRLNESPRPGVQALLQAAQYPASPGAGAVTARTIALVLGPRINAAGRVGDPHAALELLLSREEAAAERAALLDRLNQERQRIESLMVAEAQALVDGRPGESEQPVLVVAREGWMPGLTGLAANRLVDRYNRPAFLIALNGSEGRGSGRGTPGFDVFRALEHAAAHLIEFGGHPGAGGFSIRADAVEAFREALLEYAGRERPPLPQTLELDAAVKLTDLTPELAAELDLLEPQGCGNPPVRLVAYGVEVEDARPVGANGNHLKLRLRQGGFSLDAIGFGLAGDAAPPPRLDVIFRPVVSGVTGRLELKMEAFREAAGKERMKDEGGRIKDEEGRARGVAGEDLFEKAARYISQLTDLYLPEEVHREKALAPTARERLVDLREHPDRWRALGQLLAGRKAAVVVPVPAAACEVAARLRLALPEKAPGIVFFHGGLAEQRRALVELAATGEIDVLVTTPALGGQFAAERDVVVFEPLCTWAQWEWLRGCGGRDLILLFGRRERETTRRRLAGIAPPRRVLLWFYHCLRQHAARGVLRLGLAEAVGVLRQVGVPGAGRRAVETAFQVLSELGLISFSPVAGGYRIQVQPVAGKRFLPAAPTFRKRHSYKREVLSCQRHFLVTPAEALKDYFRCGIITPGGADGSL